MTSRAGGHLEVGMYQLFLVLHILGAVIAFGFGFATPVIGRMLALEPQHGNWFLRAGKRVGDTILLPASLSMAVTGVGLLANTKYSPSQLWLGLAIVIYIAAILAVVLIQRPAFTKLIELTATPPGPTGPDPMIPVLLKRSRMVGFALSGAVVVIIFLMVFKPFM